MKSLVNFGIQQDVLFNVVFIGLIIFSAILAVPKLPIDRYPNFQFGEAQIITQYPGASPEEVERLVTDVIEESLRGMVDIEFIRSTSIAKQSLVHVKFEDDSDYTGLYNELRLRVLGIQNQLPTVNGDPLVPVFNELDVDEWLPVIQINLVAKDSNTPLSKRSLTLLAKDLRTRIQQLPDVKEVLLLGDDPEQFVVALDPGLLEKYSLTTPEIISAMRNTGISPPAGTLDTPSGERLIRVDSRFRDRESILETVIRKDGDGSLIRISDVIKPLETGIRKIDGAAISSINGLDTVACKVLKKPLANTIQVREEVDKIVAEYLKAHQFDNVALVMNLDSSVKIRDGLGVLIDNLMLSVVFVLVLLFLFMGQTKKKMTITALGLGLLAAVLVGFAQETSLKGAVIGILAIFVFCNCRAAVLTVSGIVFSFLGSLLVFYLFGQSINEISLLGFVLVSGIVVDDSIVVIENIQRHREEGQDLLHSVIDGASEVFWPVVSATLTTIAAFLPMLLMTGSTGDFFSLVPISVTSALLISLLECLIILPIHVVDLERLLGPDNIPKLEKEKDGEHPTKSGIMEKLSGPYDRALRWTLGNPFTSIGTSLALFLIAVFILLAPFLGLPPILKMVFFPDDTSVVVVSARLPPGTPLKETDAMIRKLGRYLADLGEGKIRNASGIAGMTIDLSYNPVWSNQSGFLFVELPGRDKRSFPDPNSFISELRKDLESKFEKNGIDIEVAAARDGPPIGQPVNVRLRGFRDNEVLTAANDLLEFMRKESEKGGKLFGVIDLTHDRIQFSTVLSYVIHNERVPIFGLKNLEVQQFIADALDGAYVGDFRRIDEDIPIRVRLASSAIKEPAELLNIPIANDSNGRIVRFSDIGKITVNQEPASLIKRDFQRTITITGNLDEETRIGAATITLIVKKWFLENSRKYPNVAIAFGGEAESTGKSYRSLVMAFGFTVLLIYAILASQFRSYVQPLLIMSNIIFSFTGVILVMAVFGLGAQMLPDGWIRDERSYFTVQGFIAIVGLTGLVVNDAIILITFINKRVNEGKSLHEALLIAGHQRMRPILMTTVTTIAGLLPMAIGIPDFSITWSPFATCFIAGLLVSTTMTLLVVPVLYLVLNRIQNLTVWPSLKVK